MRETIEVERIVGEVGLQIKVALIENTLTDDTPEEPSKTYDVETSFYKNSQVAPVLTLVDHSACDLNEGMKIYRAIFFAMSALDESEVA